MLYLFTFTLIGRILDNENRIHVSVLVTNFMILMRYKKESENEILSLILFLYELLELESHCH